MSEGLLQASCYRSVGICVMYQVGFMSILNICNWIDITSLNMYTFYSCKYLDPPIFVVESESKLTLQNLVLWQKWCCLNIYNWNYISKPSLKDYFIRSSSFISHRAKLFRMCPHPPLINLVHFVSTTVNTIAKHVYSMGKSARDPTFLFVNYKIYSFTK